MTVARTQILPSGTSALNYFATATIYNDFASDTDSDFFEAVDALGAPVGSPLTSSSSNLGAYGELSIGLNYTKLLEPGRIGAARQFDASIRIDGRLSGDLDSLGLTAQARLQF